MSLSAPATVQMVQNVIEGVTPAYGLATDAQVNALFAPPASLQDADATTIALLSENGTIQNYYSVGDEKTITLSTGEQVTFVILGFDHDDLSDGSGKAGVTFGMKNLLAATDVMNSTSTNVGGWEQSRMRTVTMKNLYRQLPPNWKAVIKSVKKDTTAGGGTTAQVTTNDKLWLLSEVEVDGTTTAGLSNEGEQYEYWKTVNDGTISSNRIKKLANGDSIATYWWFRSSNISNSVGFRCVNSTGVVGRNNSNYSYGVCFGFCV